MILISLDKKDRRPGKKNKKGKIIVKHTTSINTHFRFYNQKKYVCWVTKVRCLALVFVKK